MSDKKNKDNYSFKEMDFHLQGMKRLLAQVDRDKLNELDALEEQFKRLRQIPDMFNKYLAERGWIAYETMNFDIMTKAVQLAEEGKLEDAESILVGYYNEKNLRFMISSLKGIEEFQPRARLIYKALDDYLAERYHACVPVVLMMIDGFVNDIEQKGFFATNIDLTVWDTIAAHDSGLNTLTTIFGKSRKKTTSEEINIPYRNGILHGRDLGYDNRKVAAKTWGALVALGDWARAVKNGRNEDKKEFIPPTLMESFLSLRDSLVQYQKVGNEKKLVDDWKPREIFINDDVPKNGDIEAYDAGSPERTLNEFFIYLSRANYGKMAQLITKIVPSTDSIGKLAGRIRKIFEGKKLIDYRFIKIQDKAAAISEIDVELTFEKDGASSVHERTFRLIFQDEDCTPRVRNQNGGNWKILIDFTDMELI
ncbi:hypothetical protein C5S36_12680 [Candidatus Methanophagaceae archaeon]|nr:hypothetical protein C5S36_12680 [Methanophagales archaeon]